jgi:NAD(P)H-nitrite reductase large subunit
VTRYAIIGNSVAANAAAERLHWLDPLGTLTLLTDEPEPYYSRCALMYYAMDHCAKRDTYLADSVHYRRLGARLLHGRAVAVDPGAHIVALAEGGELPYDRLLIASGSAARRLGVPGEDAPGLHDFLTLADATAVMDSARGARQAVVIGGGLIGAEAAEVFHVLGLETVLLIREPHFYPRFCSPEQGEIVARHFADQGIALRPGRRVTAVEAEPGGRLAALLDDTGERHVCQVAVRAIGVEPRVGFLAGSGVECGSGVLVDETMRTGAFDVWAAGDCAEIRFPGERATVIQKLWYTAQPMGWVAGENMAGGQARYTRRPDYQAAKFLELDFTSYGRMPSRDTPLGEETLVAGNGVDALRLVHEEEQVVGASFVGTALTKEDLEHLVESHLPLAEATFLAHRALGRRRVDRAPLSRIAPRERLSRRPLFWPFGPRRTWRN